MSKRSATKTLIANLSVATIGPALSFGLGTVRAEEKQRTRTQQRYRGPDPARAGTGKEAADPRPVGRAAEQQVDPARADAERQAWSRPSAAARRVRCRSASVKKSPPVVKDQPKIDLEINFDYNSADISAKSLASVQALGRALTSPT